MRLYLIVRRPGQAVVGGKMVGRELSDIDPVKIAAVARKLRELAEAELGVEVVVDYVRSD